MATEQTVDRQDFWETASSGAASLFQNVGPLAPAIKTVSSFVPEGTTGSIIDGIGNAINDARTGMVEKMVGATPEDMLAKFAADPALQTEDGKKLIQIMKDDPEFTQAFHTAMTNDPSMAPGIAGLMNADGQEGGTSLKTIVDGLADDGNRATFTQVLDAVAKSPDLDFDYTMDVVDASNAIGQKDAKPEDYKRLQTLLAKSGVKNPMLDFAVDPMAALQDAMRDPSAFFDQLAQMIDLEGPIGDMFRGIVQGMGQYVELLADPSIKEFYDKHIDPLVQDIPNAMAQLDGSAAVNANPTSPAQVNGNINVENLSGSQNDVQRRIELNKHFSYARDDIRPEPRIEDQDPAIRPTYTNSGPAMNAGMI